MKPADVLGQSTKARKERASNWSALEVLDMVAAKRQEFLEDIEVEDARELMNPEHTRWGKVASKVNEAGILRGGHSPRDALACKYKWQTLLADYKKVADFQRGTGLVGTEYFELKSKERKEKRLLVQFFEEVYVQMHDWLQHKPTMQPPHSRDLLSPGDGNYNFQEEVFESGMAEEEHGGHAYRSPGQEDPTLNMSSDSGMGWGTGPWTARGNGDRPAPQPPVAHAQERQHMDLNVEAPRYSSPSAPSASSGGFPHAVDAFTLASTHAPSRPAHTKKHSDAKVRALSLNYCFALLVLTVFHCWQAPTPATSTPLPRVSAAGAGRNNPVTLSSSTSSAARNVL